MSELLPCPFCGGEAEYGLTMAGEEAYCKKCHAAMPRLTTKAEAIEAWNSRAERTCECIAEYAKSPIDGKTIVLHRCSSCHELMRPYMNYCPNCGARRVGE